jgi:hypothetical protein
MDMPRHPDSPNTEPTEVAQRFDEGTVMIAAFAGWNDAGSAATNALQHISDTFDARLYDEIDPEPYVDFQVNRPSVVATEAGRHILWPATRVEVITHSTLRRKLVLVHGIEPNMRWRTYYQEILRIADELDCSGIVLLGALLADVPHTSKAPATVTSSNTFMQEHLGVEESDYEGPAGITSVLGHYAELDGVPAVSAWAFVPHYVPHPPAIPAEIALLDAVEDIVGEAIPRGELEDEMSAWLRGVDAFVESEPDLAEYVQQLVTDDTITEISGEKIAQEFERFLRRRGPGSTGSAGSPGDLG